MSEDVLFVLGEFVDMLLVSLSLFCSCLEFSVFSKTMCHKIISNSITYLINCFNYSIIYNLQIWNLKLACRI